MSAYVEKNLKNKGRGEFDYKSDRNEGIIVVRWHDNRAVNLVSSYCGIAPTDKSNRWSFAIKKKVEIVRPHIVKEYNHHMGTVDLCDMLMELYRSSKRSKKWCMRIVYHCIDVAVTNGWLLHRRHMKQRGERVIMPLLEFRCYVASSLLLAGKSPARKRGRPSQANSDDATPPDRCTPYSRFLLEISDMTNLLTGPSTVTQK